jgi:hypothetical protein
MEDAVNASGGMMNALFRVIPIRGQRKMPATGNVERNVSASLARAENSRNGRSINADITSFWRRKEMSMSLSAETGLRRTVNGLH